jgi:hypothetical protein
MREFFGELCRLVRRRTASRISKAELKKAVLAPMRNASDDASAASLADTAHGGVETREGGLRRISRTPGLYPGRA